jgi:hypothetical protein
MGIVVDASYTLCEYLTGSHRCQLYPL